MFGIEEILTLLLYFICILGECVSRSQCIHRGQGQLGRVGSPLLDVGPRDQMQLVRQASWQMHFPTESSRWPLISLYSAVI